MQKGNVRMKWGHVLGLLAIIIAVLSACSVNQQPKLAEYTVIGATGVYKEDDTRVFKQDPVFIALREDGIHDPSSQEISALQEPEASMKDFPFDRRGAVNWVTAIDKGIIDPRKSLNGDGEMTMMDLDILFKDTGEMPWVRFPHLAHTRWLDCSNCHPAIFIPQKGGNPKIGMDAIIAGEYCGRCHDKVAFALWTCERCHSVPHEGSPSAWWRKEDGPMPATVETKKKINIEIF